MKTANPVLPPPPALARGEIIVIALLVLAGIGGGVAAKRDLAGRRIDAAAEVQNRTGALQQAQADGVRLGRESEVILTRLKGIMAGEPAAGTSVPAAGTDSGAAAGGRTAAPMAVRLTTLNHLADLVQKGVLSTQAMSPGTLAGPSGQKLPAYMIDGQGKLAPGFGELFGLSEGEVARFQAVVSDLKQRTDEFVLSHTAARPVENGYVLEYVPAEGMAEVRDAGLANMKSILGEERYRIFAVLNGERTGDNGTTTGGPAALFDAAGNTQRTVTLTRTPTGVSYTMTSGNSGERLGSGTMGGGDVATVLANRFGTAARLLPQDFINSIPRGGAGGGRGGETLIQQLERTGEAVNQIKTAVPAGDARGPAAGGK